VLCIFPETPLLAFIFGVSLLYVSKPAGTEGHVLIQSLQARNLKRMELW
jgi:hypothetical protein